MNTTKQITCLKLNDQYDSICEDNLKVKYMLPGEVANFYNRKHKVILESDINVKSKQRARVICPVFYQCGGCDFLHIKYDEQLNMKSENVKKLYDQAGIITKHQKIISSSIPLNYRHKVVLSAFMDKTKLKLGLYRDGSKDIIPYLDCHLHDLETNELLKTVEMVLNKYKIGAYDINKNEGILKHILVRKSIAEQKMLLVFVTHGYLLPNHKNIIKDIVSKHPHVISVVQNIHHKKTHLVLLDEEKVLYGPGYITDQIDDLKFRLSSKSFYQVNPIQMKLLYQQALDMADIKKTDVLMDTYSGIGTISLLAAKRAKQVIAVETNSVAHQDALFNKKINQVNNIEFINEDVSLYMEKHQGVIDVLIMDPTRDGASESFLKSVLKLSPKKIVYISCEPVTQIRDVIMLKSKYKVEMVQPVDMFSQTVHVETVALLSLK
jgi:23S rRNA (uracil1939-C5)-methyltransferase